MNRASEQIDLESKSAEDTQKLATLLCQSIQEESRSKATGAVVVSLEGDLGVGKTTFMQGFAKSCGILESIQSPTFVIMKFYALPKKQKKFSTLIHIDAYRVSDKDILLLGWHEFIKNPKAIICVEWGDRIKKILPKNAVRVRFSHKQKDIRAISFSYAKR